MSAPLSLDSWVEKERLRRLLVARADDGVTDRERSVDGDRAARRRGGVRDIERDSLADRERVCSLVVEPWRCLDLRESRVGVQDLSLYLSPRRLRGDSDRERDREGVDRRERRVRERGVREWGVRERGLRERERRTGDLERSDSGDL